MQGYLADKKLSYESRFQATVTGPSGTGRGGEYLTRRAEGLLERPPPVPPTWGGCAGLLNGSSYSAEPLQRATANGEINESGDISVVKPLRVLLNPGA